MIVSINPRDFEKRTITREFYVCGHCGNDSVVSDDLFCSKCSSNIKFQKSWPFRASYSVSKNIYGTNSSTG